MSKIVVVAPHPDDETLGCGGTLLKHKANGDQIFWVIITGISEELGFSKEKITSRNNEIQQVSNLYNFDGVYQLQLPTTRLDAIPMADIVQKISSAFQEIEPNVIYIPYPGDVHTDHKIVFESVASCTKWFRYPSIKKVLVYETLSETDFGLNPDNNGFRPNVFVDITGFLNTKIQIMRVFSSEIGTHPFPRSEEAIRSLALIRGAAGGCAEGESFMLIREIS